MVIDHMKNSTFFIHGLESSSKGYKAQLLSRLIPGIHVHDYVGTPEERMEQLREFTAAKENILLIGSSLGGLMASIFALEAPEKTVGLILLAPALPMFDFSHLPNRGYEGPTVMIHGRADTIVPLEETVQKAESLFTRLEIQIVNDDHRLKQTTDQIEWASLIDRVSAGLPIR